MGELNCYINNIDYYSDVILLAWQKDSEFLLSLDSYNLFKVISYFSNIDSGQALIKRDLNKILKKVTETFNLFDTFVVSELKNKKLYTEEFDQQYLNYLKENMSKKTLVFIFKSLRKIDLEKVYNKADIYNYLFKELKEMTSENSSICLFDMSLFEDFNKELEKRYKIVHLLINRYQKYDVDVLSSTLFKGSTIIGKLIQDENQYIVEEYIKELSSSEEYNDVDMIGGGGSCLVYKIGKYVLKLGETRNDRKIYVNHRILASQKRKLHIDKNCLNLFYIEVMKYVETNGITSEDVQELKSDLARQGLIWSDAKPENCGILSETDDNISVLPVDYIEVAGNIDNPVDREEFAKRKRRVVVIDNDYITFNPLKSCR